MSKIFTKEQMEIAKSNGLTYPHIYGRVMRNGWPVEVAISTPKGEPIQKRQYMVVRGTVVTAEQIQTALENGIQKNTIKSRIQKGFTVEDAITHPIQGVSKHDITKDELIKIIGRLKYLKWTIPKGLKKRASELNLNIDSIKTLEVEMDDHEEEILCTEAN